MQRLFSLLLSISSLIFATHVQAQQPTQRISGEVVKLDGPTLQVKSAAGEILNVKLADNLRIIAIARTALTAITPGAYLATTSLPQTDGTLLAVEIRIFPESMRGTGEGHRAMEARPGNTMTNATVENIVSPNTMTNATVDNVTASEKVRKMTVRYKGGEQQVVLSDNVPVFKMEIADRGVLVPGARVVLNMTRQSDGSLVSDRLTVGKDGAVPPL